MEKQTNVRAQKSKNGTKITEKMNIGLISCPIIEKRYRMALTLKTIIMYGLANNKVNRN